LDPGKVEMFLRANDAQATDPSPVHLDDRCQALAVGIGDLLGSPLGESGAKVPFVEPSWQTPLITGRLDDDVGKKADIVNRG
jgi:hypothetical protein